MSAYIEEIFKTAFEALRANRLRSVLTLLGVVVGVFSIIAVMTAMRVLQEGIEVGLSSLGAHTFEVQKNPIVLAIGRPASGSGRSFQKRKNLTPDQGRKVQQYANLARSAGIEQRTYGKTVIAGKRRTNPSTIVFGTTLESFLTHNWIVQEGRAFNEMDVEFGNHVLVISSNVAAQLFPDRNPIGETVRVDNARFRVIGVLKPHQGLLMRSFVAMPMTTFQKMYGKGRSVHIVVQPANPALYQDAIEQVRGILRAARKVWPGREDDFSIFSSEVLLERFNELTFYVKVGIGSVSAISLLVAGIGIMNIMLVSITERTREIGIRRAVGAPKRNILIQFLMEAMILCQIGGVVGIVLGILAGNAVAGQLGAAASIPYDWAVIGFASCTLVGIVFGVYPAWKAANLDPIEALRFE